MWVVLLINYSYFSLIQLNYTFLNKIKITNFGLANTTF